MAENGWRLERANNLLLIFHFVEDNPKKTSFSIDYQTKIDKQYQALLEDAGWVCLGKSVGWFIWRQDYDKDKPRIYTDIQSLVERNKRLLRFLVLCLLQQFPLLIININEPSSAGNLFQLSSSRYVLIGINCFAILLFTFGIIALYLSIKKIKKSP